MRRQFQAFAVCGALVWGGGSALAADPHPPTYDALNATLWMQTSAEYKASTISAYAVARHALDRALADTTWTAALEQGENYQGKPPAIITDIDETVLNNSAYEAWLLTSGQSFSSQTFADFIKEKTVVAVPGAVAFLKYATSRGVTVFFVSNLNANLEPVTREALASLGLPLKADEDTVLLKRERREWGVQKGGRRTVVAERYRIVQLIGDNLGDFVDEYGMSLPQRAQEVRDHGSYWGSKWIMLPNPVYGNWESAAYAYNPKLGEAARRVEKLRALAPWK